VLVLGLVGAGLVLVGGVISIVGAVHLGRAAEDGFAAVSAYNHGLTRLETAPILTLPLGL
jgi:hypothetical protein